MTKPKRTLSDKLSIAGVSLLALTPVLYIGLMIYSQQIIYSLVNSRNITLPEADVEARLDNAESLGNLAIKLSLVMIALGVILLIVSYKKKRAGK